MSKVERLEAELALAKLEDTFVAAKEAGKVTDELRAELREARHDFRANHRPVVAVQPASVSAGADVKKAGGN